MNAFLLTFLLAQMPGRPDLAFYERARANMVKILDNQPNYVCAETIRRGERRNRKSGFEPVDALQLEVAYVGKREMYSWPGAAKFESTDLVNMVPEGAAVVTGAFAGHAALLFRTNAATIGTGDWITSDGKRFARFFFVVPVERSHYSLMNSANEPVKIGYSGEIQIEPETARVVRIRLHGDSIPNDLHIQATETAIEYAATRIGNGDFWLPAQSVETVTFDKGVADRNVTRFSGCREFVGVSTLRFDSDPVAGRPSPAAPETVELPGGIGFEIQFDQAIRGSIHVGDSIPASLGTNLGEFPRGSAVKVRLVRWKRRLNGIELDVSVDEVISANAVARLIAVPDAEADLRTVRDQRKGVRNPDLRFGGDMKRPSLGTIYIGDRLAQVPKGYRTAWVTMAPRRVTDPKEERH